MAKLNSELSAKLGRTITLTEERQTSESLELSNDGNSTSYRRFALWHPEYTLRISALVGTGEAISWRDRTTVTFVPPSAVALTCTDVEPRRERVPMQR